MKLKLVLSISEINGKQVYILAKFREIDSLLQ